MTEPVVGYRIADSEAMIKEALHRAFHLVTRARHFGAETRQWAQQTMHQTENLVHRAKQLRRLTLRANDFDQTLQEFIELNGLENKILQMLRHYIGEITNINALLKLLNPPLSSQQLKPFLEAVTSDRRTTIASLEPLTMAVEQLNAIKSAA